MGSVELACCFYSAQVRDRTPVRDSVRPYVIHGPPCTEARPTARQRPPSPPSAAASPAIAPETSTSRSCESCGSRRLPYVRMYVRTRIARCDTRCQTTPDELTQRSRHTPDHARRTVRTCDSLECEVATAVCERFTPGCRFRRALVAAAAGRSLNHLVAAVAGRSLSDLIAAAANLNERSCKSCCGTDVLHIRTQVRTDRTSVGFTFCWWTRGLDTMLQNITGHHGLLVGESGADLFSTAIRYVRARREPFDFQSAHHISKDSMPINANDTHRLARLGKSRDDSGY